MHRFQYPYIFCDPIINMYTLPFLPLLYVAARTSFLHLTGRRRPIILSGGDDDSQSTHACVSALYLVIPDYTTFHISKYLTVSMLKKYYPILTTCCSIVVLLVYCCVTCVKLTVCRI